MSGSAGTAAAAASAIIRQAEADAARLRAHAEQELREARSRAFAITADAHRRAEQLVERASRSTRTEADAALNDARQVLGRLIAAVAPGGPRPHETALEMLLCDGCRATVQRVYGDSPPTSFPDRRRRREPTLASSGEPSIH